MIERISCTVIRSLPLTTANNIFPQANRPDTSRPKIDDVVAVNVRVRRTNHPSIHSVRPAIPPAAINYHPTGQILNCYV